ncbi:non-ribosomal peptide synthetase [Actinomadura litoris]|uniref:non-ribosomal peptide synthetase n=1 Tax=Actinomadura litoris TaxID=2678616 RepID=UPI001FA78E62|nr:amino acid adenylation domain-containing protein [Actinomadura litoris]
MGDLPGPALSFAQQRLWFLDRLLPGNPFHNLAFAHRLAGNLDAAALADALTEIVARHEALRTRFVADGDTPRQAIDPPSRVGLAVADVSGAADPVAEARRLADAEARTPFDLARGPLLRAGLIRLADADHVMLLTLHHIVADGWSWGVLASELGTLYEAFAAGEPSPLPPLEIQYADFAEWQRDWMSGDVLEERLGYWRDRLRGMPTVLELPADRARPSVPSHTAGAVPFTVPAEVAARLRDLGARHRATLFMVLLAAFDALLAGRTGGTDIVVSAPVSGRDRVELENLIGFFVNNVVLRVDCSGDPTFGELVDRVRETTLGAFDRQDLPFERLVEELRPSRDPSRNPLTQVGLQLLRPEHTGHSLTLPGVEATVVEGHGDAIHFDVELYCFDSDDDELTGRVVYAADLFDRTTMERFAGHFVHLLGQADDDVRLSRLSTLTPEEAHRQLLEWNDTEAEYPADPVHRLFEAQAARTPNAVAVSAGDDTLTYAELDTRANRFAHRLRSLGVGPETLVGLYARRGLDAMVAMVAVLKTGGAYLPLDPEYPSERVAYMLADAVCPFVIVEDGLDLDVAGARIVRIDPAADAGRPAHPPSVDVSPDNLAYVIYTSGSTGRPKGVAVPHGGVTNVIVFQARTFGVGPRSRVLQVASFSFDASVSEIWITLARGAELVIAPGPPAGAELAELLTAREITQVAVVPSVLATLPDTRLPHLQTVLIGGEAAAPAVLNRWAPGRAVFNVYGPTEASVNASYHRCADGATGPPPIGEPIANTRIYLLDGWLRPVPVGVPGELYIGGAGVSRGYLGRPGLTASRFVADPFSPDGGRLYRTGDLARRLPEGTIDFLGRLDDQVKLRGFRIELGEVESTLAEHPAVGQVSVTVRDHRMVGYVVPADLAGLDDAALGGEHVRERQLFFDRTHREKAAAPPPNPTTVERITALRPERVLELGCGAGGLVRALLPVCRQYVAADFSSSAVDRLRADLGGTAGLSPLVREATDFRGFRPQSFGAAVVDGVARHCPSLSYLDGVVDQAVGVLADGGLLIVTDVAQDAAGDDLAVDPRYFTGLPERLSRVAEVEIVRRGDGYDAVVTAGPARALAVPEPLPSGFANDPLRTRRAGLLSRELRAFARRRLPEYMVPSGFAVLDALPLSPNGKVDVRRLPVPEAGPSTGRLPATPEEEALCALFAEVLGLDTVRPDDGFFDLGGHSLLAFRTVNLIRSRLGAEIAVGDLFTRPTPAALALRLPAIDKRRTT